MKDSNKQIYYNGAVGIGTEKPSQSLEVNGKLKVGDDERTPLAGTIRFNEKQFEGFDGQSWESFTSSGNIAPQSRLVIRNGDLKLQKNHSEADEKSWSQHILFTDEVDRTGAKITGSRQQWNGAPMELSFHTGGVGNVKEQMTIKNNGTVGIGIKNPNQHIALQIQSDRGSWKGGVAAGGQKAAVIYGEFKDAATIGGHTAALDTWDNLLINPFGGNVGVATTAPTERLEVNGNIKCNKVLQNSDIRLKEKVEPIVDALSKLNKIRGVNYRCKATDQNPSLQIGLVAQEVENIFPEVVITDESGFKSIAYSNLIAPLIEAIKELKSEKDKEIAALIKEMRAAI